MPEGTFFSFGTDLPETAATIERLAPRVRSAVESMTQVRGGSSEHMFDGIVNAAEAAAKRAREVLAGAGNVTFQNVTSQRASGQQGLSSLNDTFKALRSAETKRFAADTAKAGKAAGLSDAEIQSLTASGKADIRRSLKTLYQQIVNSLAADLGFVDRSTGRAVAGTGGVKAYLQGAPGPRENQQYTSPSVRAQPSADTYAKAEQKATDNPARITVPAGPLAAPSAVAQLLAKQEEAARKAGQRGPLSQNLQDVRAYQAQEKARLQEENRLNSENTKQFRREGIDARKEIAAYDRSVREKAAADNNEQIRQLREAARINRDTAGQGSQTRSKAGREDDTRELQRQRDLLKEINAEDSKYQKVGNRYATSNPNDPVYRQTKVGATQEENDDKAATARAKVLQSEIDGRQRARDQRSAEEMAQADRARAVSERTTYERIKQDPLYRQSGSSFVGPDRVYNIAGNGVRPEINQARADQIRQRLTDQDARTSAAQPAATNKDLLSSFLGGLTSSGFGSRATGFDGNGIARSFGSTIKFSAQYQALQALKTAFSDTVAEAIDYRDSLTDLNVALGQGADAGAKYVGSLTDIARVSGASVGDALDSAARGVRALTNPNDSESTKKNVGLDFADAANRAAIIAGKSLTDVRGDIIAIASTYGVAANNLQSINDVLAGSKLFGGDPAQISQGLANGGVALKDAGFSLAESGAVLSTVITKIDESGQAAATRLARITQALQGTSGRALVSNLGIDPNASSRDQLLEIARRRSLPAGADGALNRVQQQQVKTVLGGTSNSRELDTLLDALGTGGSLLDGFTNGFNNAGKGADEFHRKISDLAGTIRTLTGDVKAIQNGIFDAGFFAPFEAFLALAGPVLETLNRIVKYYNQVFEAASKAANVLTPGDLGGKIVNVGIKNALALYLEYKAAQKVLSLLRGRNIAEGNAEANATVKNATIASEAVSRGAALQAAALERLNNTRMRAAAFFRNAGSKVSGAASAAANAAGSAAAAATGNDLRATPGYFPFGGRPPEEPPAAATTPPRPTPPPNPSGGATYGAYPMGAKPAYAMPGRLTLPPSTIPPYEQDPRRSASFVSGPNGTFRATETSAADLRLADSERELTAQRRLAITAVTDETLAESRRLRYGSASFIAGQEGVFARPTGPAQAATAQIQAEVAAQTALTAARRLAITAVTDETLAESRLMAVRIAEDEAISAIRASILAEVRGMVQQGLAPTAQTALPAGAAGTADAGATESRQALTGATTELVGIEATLTTERSAAVAAVAAQVAAESRLAVQRGMLRAFPDLNASGLGTARALNELESAHGRVALAAAAQSQEELRAGLVTEAQTRKAIALIHEEAEARRVAAAEAARARLVMNQAAFVAGRPQLTRGTTAASEMNQAGYAASRPQIDTAARAEQARLAALTDAQLAAEARREQSRRIARSIVTEEAVKVAPNLQGEEYDAARTRNAAAAEAEAAAETRRGEAAARAAAGIDAEVKAEAQLAVIRGRELSVLEGEIVTEGSATDMRANAARVVGEETLAIEANTTARRANALSGGLGAAQRALPAGSSGVLAVRPKNLPAPVPAAEEGAAGIGPGLFSGMIGKAFIAGTAFVVLNQAMQALSQAGKEAKQGLQDTTNALNDMGKATTARQTRDAAQAFRDAAKQNDKASSGFFGNLRDDVNKTLNPGDINNDQEVLGKSNRGAARELDEQAKHLRQVEADNAKRGEDVAVFGDVTNLDNLKAGIQSLTDAGDDATTRVAKLTEALKGLTKLPDGTIGAGQGAALGHAVAGSFIPSAVSALGDAFLSDPNETGEAGVIQSQRKDKSKQIADRYLPSVLDNGDAAGARAKAQKDLDDAKKAVDAIPLAQKYDKNNNKTPELLAAEKRQKGAQDVVDQLAEDKKNADKEARKILNKNLNPKQQAELQGRLSDITEQYVKEHNLGDGGVMTPEQVSELAKLLADQYTGRDKDKVRAALQKSFEAKLKAGSGIGGLIVDDATNEGVNQIIIDQGGQAAQEAGLRAGGDKVVEAQGMLKAANDAAAASKAAGKDVPKQTQLAILQAQQGVQSALAQRAQGQLSLAKAINGSDQAVANAELDLQAAAEAWRQALLNGSVDDQTAAQAGFLTAQDAVKKAMIDRTNAVRDADINPQDTLAAAAGAVQDTQATLDGTTATEIDPTTGQPVETKAHADARKARDAAVLAQAQAGREFDAAKADSGIDSRDSVGLATQAVTDAQANLDGQTKGTLGFYQATKALADAKLALGKANDDLASANEAASVDPDDKVGQATLALDDANRNLAAQLKGTAEYARAQRAVQDALLAQAQAQRDAASIHRTLGFDFTDPALMAQEATRKAKEDYDAAVAAGRGQNVTDPLKLTYEQAQSQQETTETDQRLNQAKTNLDLGRISHQKYISILQQEKARLESIGTLTFAQNQELDKITGLIKDAASSMDGSFNVGDIKLPTVNAVRTSIANQEATATPGSSLRAAASTGQTVNVTINGGDLNAVKQIVGNYLGPQAFSTAAAGTTSKV